MNIADLLSRLPLMELDETTSDDVADLYVRFIVKHNDSERAISIEEIKVETGKDETLSFLSNLIQSSIWSEHEITKPFRLMRH